MRNNNSIGSRAAAAQGFMALRAMLAMGLALTAPPAEATLPAPVSTGIANRNALDNTPIPCPLGNSTCIPDSLLTFQALNDPNTSPLAHGSDTRGSLGGNKREPPCCSLTGPT